MNGDQAKSVILGDGLASTMVKGSVVLLTATVKANEARDLAAGLEGTGISLDRYACVWRISWSSRWNTDYDGRPARLKRWSEPGRQWRRFPRPSTMSEKMQE